MMAARPLTPSRFRSTGSSSASSDSSGIASTSPAPKSGMGTRRAKMVASAGITRLTRMTGNREEVKQRLARRIEGDELAARAASCGAHFCRCVPCRQRPARCDTRRSWCRCRPARALHPRSRLRGSRPDRAGTPRTRRASRRPAARRAAPPGVWATSRPRTKRMTPGVIVREPTQRPGFDMNNLATRLR